MNSNLDKVQRQPLSLKQLRTTLHFLADGINVPRTALVSRQKFILFMKFCDEEMLKSSRKNHLPAQEPRTKRRL